MKNRAKTLGNRIIGILTILTLLTYIIINILNTNIAYAKYESESKQPREDYNSSKIDKYPGYKELIEKIKAAHPNWKIKIHYTNLDWKTVLENETTGAHTRNLVPIESISSWICPECGSKPQDSGLWVCASEAIVAYFMDPRNWINDDYIFQFEQSVFNSSIHSSDGVMSMTSGSFLEGRTNADAIIQACKNVNINPYQVVSRILQEQGKSGSTMSRGNEGYYNVFNVEASGNSSAEIIRNATKYAREQGWDTLAKSIIGGIDFLKSKYIGQGQDTLYLQKFDVDDNGSLFYHQYMQNLQAAKNESTKIRSTYANLGFFNNSIEFLIPVYENMPSVPCTMPGTENIVTQNAQIKAGHTNIQVRESAGTSAKSLKSINSGEKFLRIEIGTQNINGHYWDKIVLSDGTKGYIATTYVEQINDIITCNETVKLTGSDVRLRNGPGTAGTVVKEYLSKGQIVTRIEKNKYNLDGLYWDRVTTSEGIQGYVASKYLEVVSTNDKFKIDEKNLKCEPYTSVENIKAQYSNAVIKKSNGETVTTGQIGTGYIVTIDNRTYTVVKLGDTNGDGKVTSADYVRIKNKLRSVEKLNEFELLASDANSDGSTTSSDYVKVKNVLRKKEIISIVN